MSSLVAISFLLGLVHVASPDHWVPLSLQGWQRSWNSARIMGLGSQLLALHVATGLLAALLLREWALGLGEQGLLAFSLAMVVLFAGLRFLRFSKLREAFLAGPQSKRGILATWALLGPAESLVPVVLRSVQSGHGYLIPVLAYLAGTLLAGNFLFLAGRRLWNQPVRLAQGYAWVSRLSFTR